MRGFVVLLLIGLTGLLSFMFHSPANATSPDVILTPGLLPEVTITPVVHFVHRKVCVTDADCGKEVTIRCGDVVALSLAAGGYVVQSIDGHYLKPVVYWNRGGPKAVPRPFYFRAISTGKTTLVLKSPVVAKCFTVQVLIR
jgi:hypothetical protein